MKRYFFLLMFALSCSSPKEEEDHFIDLDEMVESQIENREALLLEESALSNHERIKNGEELLSDTYDTLIEQ